jgi:dATP pyrophosphohydrolase
VRAPFQVLIFGFRRSADVIEYLSLRRRDLGVWQGIAGGGEGNETPQDAARREAFEEASIRPSRSLYRLATVASVPVTNFAARDHWSPDLYVIPEYTFAIDCECDPIVLSDEHTDYQWLPYDASLEALHWESNRIALWELSQRISRGDLLPLA